MSRMTLSDRIEIEAGIYARKSLSEIAEQIHKSRRYVSEELRRNATKIPGEHPLGKRCRNATGCRRGSLCGKENCHQMCYTCKEVDCQTVCRAYNDDPCKELQKPPYVCNVCSRRRKCKSDRVYYTAQQADAVAKRRYAEARNKPQMQKEAMAALDALVTPLIKKGQPLTHIYAEHGAELPVSQRTLYNYIDSGRLSVGNLDLRRKVGYRPRKKKQAPTEGFLNQKYRQDRTYEDFFTYMAQHPKATYVEMDTVKGCREQGKRMLTLIFVEQNLMLIFLMRDGKAETVVEQFDWLTAALGLDTFRKLFPIILTDNGAEFKHTREMEFTVDGQRRTRIYYCDPQASWQKPHVEKNHEYIRYVLPRGKSFSPYTQEDIILLLNHINSTRRSKLGGKTPFELADSEKFLKLKEVMGLTAIPADEVDLTPRLLRKKKATIAKQEVTAHNPFWRGDIHFCNGGLHLVCFAMLKYMKSAMKRA